MAGEWQEINLGEAIELKRGYDLPSREREDGPFPIVSSSGISGRHAEARAKAPGVVIGRYGTLGEVHYITEDYWPLNTALYVGDFKGNDPRFISYFLRTLDFTAYSDKAAVPGLNRNDLHTAQVILPPVPDQRAIAHILGTLDDKIELNRRMSETLEAMARALFQSWFVDFDPVRAKIEGRWQRSHPLPEGEGRGEGLPRLPSDLLAFARKLRRNETNAERLLWRLLRNRSLAGAKFRRQHPFPPYVLDFYCHELKLAIELDGSQHNLPERRLHDKVRTAKLAEHGIRVLRFWNHEVLRDPKSVLEAIYQTIVERREELRPSPPAPLPGGDGSMAPGLPADLYDLFPARLVDSELGPIPKGWKVKAFADTVEIIGGGTPKTSVPEYWNGDIPWFSVVDAPSDSEVWVVDTEKKVTQAEVENSSTRVLPVGTTIISARGTVGRVALVGVPMAMNQSCYGLRGRSGAFGFFNYFLTRELVDRLQQHAHGSVFDTITRDTLASISVVAPAAELIEKFEERVAPSLERIRAGLTESRTLAALRDALLPKLIRGEIRVKDAERFLKERGL